MFFRPTIHQFQKQSRLFLIQNPSLYPLSLIFRPREQTSVLHLLFIWEVMMLLNISLEQIKVPMPTLFVGHIFHILPRKADERRASRDTRGRFFTPLAVSGGSQSLQRAIATYFLIL